MAMASLTDRQCLGMDREFLHNLANPVPLMDIHKLVKIIGEGD